MERENPLDGLPHIFPEPEASIFFDPDTMLPHHAETHLKPKQFFKNKALVRWGQAAIERFQLSGAARGCGRAEFRKVYAGQGLAPRQEPELGAQVGREGILVILGEL